MRRPQNYLIEMLLKVGLEKEKTLKIGAIAPALAATIYHDDITWLLEKKLDIFAKEISRERDLGKPVEVVQNFARHATQFVTAFRHRTMSSLKIARAFPKLARIFMRVHSTIEQFLNRLRTTKPTGGDVRKRLTQMVSRVSDRLRKSQNQLITMIHGYVKAGA